MKKAMYWMLMLSLLSGCEAGDVFPYARELGETALIRTVGLDAWGDEVLLSAVAEGDGGYLSASGVSVAGAARAVQSLGARYVYYGHANRLLLGEEMAVRGVAEVMDYLAREPQLGPGMQLWVVRDGTAAQAVETAQVSQHLDRLNVDRRFGASSVSCSAAQLMSVLARRGSVCVPALRVLPPRSGDGGEGGERTLVPEGYAVLRQGKLVGFTDEETSRGIELMQGENGGGVVVLKLDDGTAVSLVTDDARVRCEPVFRGGEPVGIEIVCRVPARVAQTGRRLTERELDEVEWRLERLLGERAIRAVELSQYWDADFLDLERRAQLAAPHQREAIDEQWPTAFRSLALRAEVLVRLERSVGLIKERG